MVGYVLLIVGFVVVIIPTYFGISIVFTGASAIPKILETPVLSNVTIPMGNATIVLPISTADIKSYKRNKTEGCERGCQRNRPRNKG